MNCFLRNFLAAVILVTQVYAMKREHPEGQESEAKKLTKTDQRTVVLDLDGTVVWSLDGLKNNLKGTFVEVDTKLKELIQFIQEKIEKDNMIEIKIERKVETEDGFKTEILKDRYFVAPNLKHFIKYLLKEGFIILFYSSGTPERNEALVGQYLELLFTKDELEIHKQTGNFKVFSRNSLVNGRKDLKKIMGEQKYKNAVMIDDSTVVLALDQKLSILGRAVPNLIYDYWIKKDLGKEDFLALNHVPYFLGILDTCLEEMRLQK